MKILVTGANGYIGQGVVKQLLNDGQDVVATDFKCDHIDKRAKIICADLFAVQDPFAFFDKPDVVLHLAWRNGFVHNASSHIDDLPKHYSFCKAMIEAGIARFIGMGSMHEIGFHEGSIDENTPTNPITLYGIAKDALRRSTELLCKNCDVKFQWIRGYYIVGNSKYGSSIFSKITAAEENGEKEFPFTLGKNQWDFIDYDVLCKQISKIVSQDKILGIINACSGYPQKLADRVEKFIKDNHYHIKLKYGAFPDRPYDSKAVWGNNKKIEEIMNM